MAIGRVMESVDVHHKRARIFVAWREHWSILFCRRWTDNTTRWILSRWRHMHPICWTWSRVHLCKNCRNCVTMHLAINDNDCRALDWNTCLLSPNLYFLYLLTCWCERSGDIAELIHVCVLVFINVYTVILSTDFPITKGKNAGNPTFWQSDQHVFH